MRSATGVTDRRIRRGFRLAAAGTGIALAAVLAFPLGAPAQANGAGVSFDAVKKQIDTLKRQGLVSRKVRSLDYILDPELNRETSYCYSPYAGPGTPGTSLPAAPAGNETGTRLLSLADSGVQKFAELAGTRDVQGNVKAYGVALSVMDEFFKEFGFRRQARSSLDDFLKREGGLAQERTDPLLTVGLRFWVERGADERPEDGVLVCRLEVRAFKVTLAPIPSSLTTMKERTDLTHLELLFQDSAVGRVRLKDFLEDGEAALRNVMHVCFLDRVAVNFCLSPALQTVLEDVDKRKVDVKNGSIARKD